MPDMDGIEFLRAAREFYPDIGIILMTAFGTIDTAREAFKLGADDFLAKPFNNEELIVIVERALERKAARLREPGVKACPAECGKSHWRLTRDAKAYTSRSRQLPGRRRPSLSPANQAAERSWSLVPSMSCRTGPISHSYR